jgi:hypothetical protein
VGETKNLGDEYLPKKGWRGFVARYLFPTICGLIVTSFGGYCTTQLNRLATLEELFANEQRDHEVVIRWLQQELNTLLAEEAATHKLQMEQQIQLGILEHKVNWALDRGPEGPVFEAGPEPGPKPEVFDYERLAKSLADRVGRTSKVSPEDLHRIRTDQRQLPQQEPEPSRKKN